VGEEIARRMPAGLIREVFTDMVLGSSMLLKLLSPNFIDDSSPLCKGFAIFFKAAKIAVLRKIH
jgi:hypothetical protein